MSGEIKIKFGEVEKKLIKLHTSSNALISSLPTDIGGNTVLDVVAKLNTLNSTLSKVVQSYKSLCLKNEEATSQAVQSMKETDEKIAVSMTFR